MSESNGAAIQKVEAHKKPIPIVNGVLTPETMDDLWRLANLYIVSGLVPAGVKSPEQAFIALECGLSLGLSPAQAMQGIMIVNNRPTVWGDSALAVCQATGKMRDIKEYFEAEGKDGTRAVCEVYRSDRESATIRTFSTADAKTAGLLDKSGPWKQYPKRMLQMRARAFALRDSFADALRGIGIREEVDDYTDLRSNAAPPPSAKVEQRRAMLADPVIEVEPAPAETGPINITTEEIDSIFKEGK